MITDKEYPATHSMSTAWYMVDADGNVGLMAFDDNGPVPAFNNVQPDLGLPDLVFGQGFSSDYICGGIHLNVSQIHELLGVPRKPDGIEYWFEFCLAIEPKYTSEFLFLCENKDITNYGCVSNEMNLYFVDAFDCIDSNNNSIIEGSTLDKMIKGNIIRAIYQVPELDVNSEYDTNTESVVFEKSFDNAPYYIYCQSYWTSNPQHRMNVPSNPVKLTQLEEKYREGILQIPIRFKEMEDMQIAQWFVCDTYGPKLLLDDAGYSLLPIDRNINKYCLTRPFFFDFYEYCPNREQYCCEKCSHECVSTVRVISSLNPTILYVVTPSKERRANLTDLPQEINDKIAVFSYIPKFPYKEQGYWMNIDRVKKLMTNETLISLLSYSSGWFERIVRTINPQVIIIDDEALAVFTSVFPIANNNVVINNTTYPIFEISSVKENAGHIIAFAQLPYRGKIFPMTYSEQEVDDLKRQGKVSEQKW